jgi:glucose-6-phosphate 1-epimerase
MLDMQQAVELTEGPQGQALIRLHGPCGSRVEVYQYGGHVTSWISKNGREMLYMSPTAVLDGSKAIRGGIPVCFPQFGQHGPLKQHGFARNSMWALVDPEDADEDDGDDEGTCPRVQLVLTDSAQTRQSEWPHKFKVVQTIEIDKDGSLVQKMDVYNTGTTPFEFSIALHAYLAVHDSSETVVPGLRGLLFADGVKGGVESTQVLDFVKFGEEVDRLYYASSDKLRVPAAGIELYKGNLPDVVLWNPHIQKAAALADMPNDDWKNFVCVEPARVKEKARVQPGARWNASLVLKPTAAE